MTYITTLKYVFTLFFILYSACSVAKFKVAYVDVPPFAYQDANGDAQGELITAFEKIIHSLGMEAEFLYVPHKRLLSFIEQGKIDLWAGLDNSRVNNDLTLTSKTPLFIMQLDVYWKVGTPKVDNLKDLVNKPLILISSYSYGGNYSRLLEESAHVTHVINHEDGFNTLFASKDNYFLGYNAISQRVIEKFHIEGYQKASLENYQLYLKMAKNHPNASNIMHKVDEFLLTHDPDPSHIPPP